LTTKIRWLGHATFQVVTNTGKMIYLDPWISKNPVCPIKLEDVKQANIVCVTHSHGDHFGDAIEIAKKTKAYLVCTPEIARYAQIEGIPYDKGNSCPLNIGGSVELEGVKIVMTNAVHTTELWTGSQLLPASGACGYVIITQDGVRIYFAGDTGLFGDMRLIGEIYSPNIAILPVGGRYNMTILEGAYASLFLNPEFVIPMHHGTFPNQMADLEEFKRLVKSLSIKPEVVTLKVGETFEYKR